MTEKRCIIYYDRVLNDNEYHREREWEGKHPADSREPRFCCSTMESHFHQLNHDVYDGYCNHRVGHSYHEFGETYFDGFKKCPWCGAEIVYDLADTYRYERRAHEVVDWVKVKQ